MPKAKNLGFKRRREALTNYKKRLALVKSGLDRVVVRKTNKRIIGEAVRYVEKGDSVLAYADSNELKRFNWPNRPNRPTAYLTGLLLAKKTAQKIKNGSEYILDIGLSSPVKDSIPFVFAKGCMDGGMRIKSNISVEEGIYNYSDIRYAEELMKRDREAYERQYSKYLKDGLSINSLHKLFNETKERIIKE